MTSNNVFLAVFLGSKAGNRRQAWMALSDAERHAKEQEGIAAWQSWMQTHQDAVVGSGGPLGKTKRIGVHGIEDASNDLGAFLVIRAESHQAAAQLFENHPHFTIFPGEAVEVMPVMPIPGA